MTAPLSDTRLTEMAARAAAATAGPWRATEATDACVSLIHTDDGQATLVGRVAVDANAEFIAHAREDVPDLLAEIDRLRAELAASCPADCPCRQIPLTAHWDNAVCHPNPADTEDTETVVCCVADGGQPVAVMLDDDQREALGLKLLLPDGDGDIDPQHLELVRENERLRSENAVLLGETVQLGSELAELRALGAGQ